MLEEGGNAVDAAVAAAFTAFVVEQVDCGLGGFAHLSLWDAARGESLSVDGYVRAPAGAHATMFPIPDAPPTYYGHPASELQRYGGLSVAVPGAVAGLCEAHALRGRLPREAVLAPAIEAADRGVSFTWRDVLAVAEHQARIRRMRETAAVLLPGGLAPRLAPQEATGARLDTSALARTLRCIAAEGADGFHRGEVARAIAGAVRSVGGILSEEDLAAYRPRIVREPPARYRDLALTTCGDHVAYEVLQILDGFALGDLSPKDAAHLHLVAEALAISFTDCLTHYGDPEHAPSPVSGLRSRAYAAERRAQIRSDRALPRPVAAGDPWPFEAGAEPLGERPHGPAPVPRGGTSQIVAADREGNAVSIITAVGWTFGSLVYASEAGVFLNNGMSYFDPRPGRPSSIAPHKMPMFGAPALVAARDGDAVFAAAGSGGYRIETAVLSALIHVVDHDMAIDDALALPRIHSQGGATYVDGRVAPSVREALVALGHELTVLDQEVDSFGFGRVCAATRAADGAWVSSAEPSWTTAVASV